MITNAISSAARLSLTPAKVAVRVGGSLLRELRGDGAADARAVPSSGRADPAAPARAKAQPKRAAARTRAKGQPKRATTGTRAKPQPKRATTRTRAKPQPKRATTRAPAKVQPRHAAQRKPLDDVTVARKVESIIFRGSDVDKGKVDVNVAGGVVSLRGEVRTSDLINELEARAARVTEVRRVENLLHLPETPAPTRTDTPAPRPETSGSVAPAEDGAAMPGETSEHAPAPASGLGTRNFEAGGKAPGPVPAGSAGGAADSAARSPAGDETAGQESPDVTELDKHPEGDESAAEQDPDVAELGEDPAYLGDRSGVRGLNGG
jgi:hypothetical protein